MKSLTLMIGACVVILLLGAVLAGIEAFIMTDRVEPFNIITAVSQNTTTVTLHEDLFDDKTINVEIASNVTLDAAIPASYVSSSHQLLITGLLPNLSHRLTVTYKVDALWYFPAVGIAAKFWPIFIVLGVIGLIVAAIVEATRRGDD